MSMKKGFKALGHTLRGVVGYTVATTLLLALTALVAGVAAIVIPVLVAGIAVKTVAERIDNI